MERHTCRLCSRRFANGRALGGHMRSHLAAAKHPPSPQEEEEEEELETEAFAGSYSLRENPRKSFRMVDPEFSEYAGGFFLSSGNSSSVVVQDGESEAESARPPRRRRRARSARPRAPREQEPVLSSVSDVTPDEDVALCLVMLSRDCWSRALDHAADFDDSEGDLPEASDGAAPAASRRAGRSRYECGTCGKVFRSYQALGGHRASHKKTKEHRVADDGDDYDEEQEEEEEEQASSRAAKPHVCPFCSRVFASGQALGGHKRSHLAASAPAPAQSFIDLNLPAPGDDFSALSDAAGD